MQDEAPISLYAKRSYGTSELKIHVLSFQALQHHANRVGEKPIFVSSRQLMSAVRRKLVQFHDSHFPGQPLPPLSHPTLGFTSTDTTHELHNTLQDDDMLGCYDDGAKRTLSDEQVAIFRHTEIQELLKERREKAAGRAGSAARSSPHEIGSWDETTFAEGNEQLSTPLSMNEKEQYQTGEVPRLFENTRTHLDFHDPASHRNHPDLFTSDQILDSNLPADQPTSVKVNFSARKVVTYEDNDLAPSRDMTEAASSRARVDRSRFAWPELHHENS
jgi:Protein of unknown function (DUF3807)